MRWIVFGREQVERDMRFDAEQAVLQAKFDGERQRRSDREAFMRLLNDPIARAKDIEKLAEEHRLKIEKEMKAKRTG